MRYKAWFFNPDSSHKLLSATLLGTLLASVSLAVSEAAPSSNSPSVIKVNKKVSSQSQKNIEQADEKLENAERALLESFALQTTVKPTPVVKAVEKVESPKQKVVAIDKQIPAKAAVEPDIKEVKVHTAKVAEAAEPIAAKNVIKNVDPEIALLREKNEKLSKDLEEATMRILALTKEVDGARSTLMVSETEVNRLSTMLARKTGALPIASSPQSGSSHSNVRDMGSSQHMSATSSPMARMQGDEDSQLPARDTNLPVATISVDKADLRTGPGVSNEQVMTLPRGARVVIETRRGEWYRVFSPSGERAWLHSSVVTFGDKVTPMNDSSAARVRGFNGSLEDRAFKNISVK